MATRRKNTKQGAEVTTLFKMATPKGVAAFAYLKRPDDAFGELKFRINIILDPKDAKVKAFVKKMRDTAKEEGVKNLPIKKASEKLAETLDIPVGTPYLALETKVKDEDDIRPIPIFNARRQKDETLEVWGGDIVKAEVSVATWTMNGDSGLKLYLNAVQLLKSMGGGGGSTGETFEEEEDFIEDEEEVEEEEGSTLVDEDEFEDVI